MAALIDKHEVFLLVSAAEGDMRAVYDYALILHDKMSDQKGITDEMQAALVHLTGQLCGMGHDLRQHCDKLYALAGADQ